VRNVSSCTHPGWTQHICKLPGLMYLKLRKAYKASVSAAALGPQFAVLSSMQSLG
jgi:hypothetical protein